MGVALFLFSGIDLQALYSHTQRSPLGLMMFAVSLLFLFSMWLLRDVREAPAIVYLPGVLIFIMAAGFQNLTVRDEGDALRVQFGPLPLFRRRERYDRMQSVEVGRTTLLDGWGIHYGLRGGWVWNIWGRDCVVLRLDRAMWVIGTDEPQKLAAFLEERIALAKLGQITP